MRDLKKYIGFTLALGAALCAKFYTGEMSFVEIEEFRGAVLDETVWNPLISSSVNEKKLTASIDSYTYSNNGDGIYMDENLNIMIPASLIRDSLNCSVQLYDAKELLIEKYNNTIRLRKNNQYAYINTQKVELESPMVYKAGEYYIPLETVSKELGYSYDWDVTKNQVKLANTSGETSILPAAYDLRKKKRNPAVKDQGSRGTCWAFSALTALESTLLPEEKLNFSPDHMSLKNSFASNGNDGGQYTMSMAYLTSWQGPVLEKDDPYDGVGEDDLQAVKHVQEAQIIESKNLSKIKEAVFKYGGVQSAIYSTLQNANSYSDFYNRGTNSYCYVGQEKPNHDVVIIGWDDNYSKKNFNTNIEGDGAFICQNSWGESFGENGVFYVSYYDTNIGVHNVVYTDIEETDNYDRIYQSDLCGWVGQLGYSRESAYGANVYTAKENEEVLAAGFYATGKNTEYEIYVIPEFTGEESLSKGQCVATGKVENAGFYTIEFTKAIRVTAGQKFAVMMKVTTPDSVHPLAIEYEGDESTRNVDLTDGEGYISLFGTDWERVEKTQDCNLCIKAYTKER